jgi:hypothetical protein
MNKIDEIYELRDGSGAAFTARSPTIFEESKVIMIGEQENPVVPGQHCSA